MELGKCSHLHFIQAIRSGGVEIVSNVDSCGRPGLVFKGLKDIYDSEDLEKRSNYSTHKLVDEHYDMVVDNNSMDIRSYNVKRKTEKRKRDFEIFDHGCGNGDKGSDSNITLKQLKKGRKAKKRKIIDSDSVTVEQEEDESDLMETISSWKSKVFKNSKGKKKSHKKYAQNQNQENSEPVVSSLDTLQSGGLGLPLTVKVEVSETEFLQPLGITSDACDSSEICSGNDIPDESRSYLLEGSEICVVNNVCYGKFDDIEDKSTDYLEMSFPQVADSPFMENEEVHTKIDSSLAEKTSYLHTDNQFSEVEILGIAREPFASDLEESNDDIFKEPSLLDELNDDICKEPSLIDESNDDICKEPSLLDESNDDICKGPSLIDESNDDICKEPSLLDESNDDICKEPSLIDELNDDICKEPSLLDELNDEICKEPSLIDESKDGICEEPSLDYEFVSSSTPSASYTSFLAANNCLNHGIVSVSGDDDLFSSQDSVDCSAAIEEKKCVSSPGEGQNDPSDRNQSSDSVDGISIPGIGNYCRMGPCRSPERLLSTRKVISPTSQERLCQAMKGVEVIEDVDHFKCKEKLHFENTTEKEPLTKEQCAEYTKVDTPLEGLGAANARKVILRPNRNTSKKASPPESNKKSPNSTRSLPNFSTATKSLQRCTESAVVFSQRQMHDFESLATKLMLELNSMKGIIEGELKYDLDEVKMAIKSARKAEETTKKWLSMMTKDCNRFCTIMKLIEKGDVSFPNNTQKERRKIMFADEAGGELCHVKVFEDGMASPDSQM